jgi:two-component system nitrate/nitrite response regulator NarL
MQPTSDDARARLPLSPETLRAPAADRFALTARELEILIHIAEGESAPAIARALYISLGTVKTHLQNLYAKLGVSDRAAAVAVAMRAGVIE